MTTKIFTGPDEIAEADRFKPGTRCRVIRNDQGDYGDFSVGDEVIIEGYVPLDQRDTQDDEDATPYPPYYMAEDTRGNVFGGCIPHAALEFLKSAEQEAEDNRMPTLEELAKFISKEILTRGWEGIDVNEVQVLKKAPKAGDSSFEGGGLHGFKHGVELYGQLEGGKAFGAIIRITGLWETN